MKLEAFLATFGPIFKTLLEPFIIDLIRELFWQPTLNTTSRLQSPDAPSFNVYANPDQFK